MKKPRKPKKEMTGTAAPSGRRGKSLGIWVPSKLKDTLDELAKRNDRSVTAEIIRALRRHFEAEGIEWTREMERDPGED
jgi:hypothetical protein